MDKFQIINDIFDVLQGNDELCKQAEFIETYQDLYFELESDKNRIRVSDNDTDLFLSINEQPVFADPKEANPKCLRFHDNKEVFEYVVAYLNTHGANKSFVRKFNELTRPIPKQLTFEL